MQKNKQNLFWKFKINLHKIISYATTSVYMLQVFLWAYNLSDWSTSVAYAKESISIPVTLQKKKLPKSEIYSNVNLTYIGIKEKIFFFAHQSNTLYEIPYPKHAILLKILIKWSFLRLFYRKINLFDKITAYQPKVTFFKYWFTKLCFVQKNSIIINFFYISLHLRPTINFNITLKLPSFNL